MRVELRSDGQAYISGYVSAVARDSRQMSDRNGVFVEQIVPGAFRHALERADNVELRFNHKKVLGSVADGSLKLWEDAIGLRAETVISDPEVVEKARRKELRGWSFAFRPEKERYGMTEDHIRRRYLESFSLSEVSILDSTKTPAYIGTTIEYRDDDSIVTEFRGLCEETQYILPEEKTKWKQFDLSAWEKELQLLEREEK